MKRHITILWGICTWAVAGCLELDTTTHSSTSSGTGGAGATGGTGGMTEVSASSTSSSSSSSSGVVSVCGNLSLEDGEECDDGNSTSNDGCSPNCTSERVSSLFVGTPGAQGTADGIGTAARLSVRSALAIFGDTLYIGNGGAVRTANIDTAQVTTIAGAPGMVGMADAPVGSAARFQDIDALATDGTTLWVGDEGNHVLRSVSLTPPYAVATLAGTPGMAGCVDGVGLSARVDSIRGLAYYGGKIYLVDATAFVLRSYDPMTAQLTTLAGMPYMKGFVDGVGSDARFMSPRSLTSDDAGKLYIADTSGASIRQYDIATNTVRTIFGNGTCGYVDGNASQVVVNRPRGTAHDGKSIYWSEYEAYTIRRGFLESGQVVTLSGTVPACALACTCAAGMPGGYAEGIGPNAQWNTPHQMVYHKASNSLFVSDAGNFVIRRMK